MAISEVGMSPAIGDIGTYGEFRIAGDVVPADRLGQLVVLLEGCAELTGSRRTA
jgi:hypothetical protein